MALAALTVHADAARAGCNLIPGTEKAFNSTLGATNRPFAAPGESLEVKVRPCDAASLGLTADVADQLVTVVFTPPSGPRHAVVLTSAADCNAINPLLPACGSQLTGGGTASCVAGAAAGMQIVDRNGERRLSFRFPDTDTLLDAAGDDHTLSGPAAIAVSRAGDPLPCGLASAPCSALTGLRACIDAFFANDGACGTSVAHATFPRFTALPPPNDYAEDCFDEAPPCTAGATEMRFAVDSDGNLLLPVGWQGVLVPAAFPVPRLLRANIRSPLPFAIPDQIFVGSFSPEGGALPPIFEPQIDPNAPPDVVTLFGSVDAPYTILRFARQYGTCNGGTRVGLCSGATDCPGGTCQTICSGDPLISCSVDADCGADAPCGELFDFGSGGFLALPRVPLSDPGICQATVQSCAADCGPDGPCVSYAFQAQSPVALDSLGVQTGDVRSFTASEAVDNRDRNGDGDTLDTVVTLRGRQSGATQALGAPAGCGIAGTPDARAVVRVNQPPFSFPAVAVENEVLAFLESELGSKRCMTNGDEDFADAVLRVFRLGAGEISIAPPRAVDAALKIDGRSLAVSNGKVFFRSSEPAMATRLTERVSVGPAGLEADAISELPVVSADGRYIGFTSRATNLVGPGADTNGVSDLFLHDRQTGTTERINIGPAAVEADGSSTYPPSISSDGRFVAFTSGATNLLGPGLDTNARSDIFVRDRQTGTNERVSVGPGGVQANNTSIEVSISADGRFVAFRSDATNLLTPGLDTNGRADIFVHDRQLGVTERVSLAPGGAEANDGSYQAAISADGRFVTYTSDATNLLGPGLDTNGFSDVFVYDRLTGVTERVSTGPGGLEANSTSFTDYWPISADGRFVAFVSYASNLIGAGGDTNGFVDIYVHDRLTGLTERVSGGLNGVDGNADAQKASISEDGRWVVFSSEADNLLGPGGDTNAIPDVFLRDRQTGTTERISVGPGGLEGNAPLQQLLTVAISADGRFVAFAHDAFNLVPGDTNAVLDVFVRGIDPADPLAVDALQFADGDLDDTVLEVLDTAAPSPTPNPLCPADEVAIAGGMAAFLRPESAVGTAACPAGSLNAPDADASDVVVQFWPGAGPVQNLQCPATAVALSTTRLAALVSECAQTGVTTSGCAAGGTDLNADGDAGDTVLEVHAIAAGAGACALPGSNATWTNVGQAADAMTLAGNVAAFITPEDSQGGSSINADSDTTDRVLQVYDAAASQLILGAGTTPRAQAAEELVIGEPASTACGTVQLIAFRTSEAAEGANLNATSLGQTTGDSDTTDFVLQVYDAVSHTLINTGQAVTPCTLEACDPRLPYRITGSKVKFLTQEPEQGGPGSQDLDGNGANNDLVLQVFDFCAVRSGPTLLARARSATDQGVVTVIGRLAAAPGQDPLLEPEQSRALVSNAGRCDLGTTCDPDLDTCGAGAFCADDRCNIAVGLCGVHSSLACTTDADCARCTLRQPASCQTDGDCPTPSTCGAQLITAVTAVVDTDDDGVPDEQDKCSTTYNPEQADADHDGVGDLCDDETALALLPGTKLVVKDRQGDASKRRLVLLAKNDTAIVTGLAGSGADPTLGGAEIILQNPTTAETATIALPKEHWTGLGKPAGVKGYQYRDPELADGPCKTVLLKPGKLLRALCKGNQLGFTLDEPSQDMLAVKFLSGSAGAQSYCFEFGGVIAKDVPSINGRTGTFQAADAAPPVTCPIE